MTLKTFFTIAAIVWTLTMLVGCLLPNATLPSAVFSVSDKWLHVWLFAGFSSFWLLAGQGLRRIILLGILYGILIEILQALLPTNRRADVIDAIADAVGVLLGVGVIVLFRRYVIPRF